MLLPYFTMIPAILLAASIILFRTAPWLLGQDAVKDFSGYTPLMAFAVCGGVFLPRRWAVAVPVLTMVATEVAVTLASGGALHGGYLTASLVCLLLGCAMGWSLRKNPGFLRVLGVSALGSAVFYLISNTVAFFSFPGYAPTLDGWVQCLTTGLPQFRPTTMEFGLRQLAGDVVFSALFCVSVAVTAKSSAAAAVKAGSPALAPQSHPVG